MEEYVSEAVVLRKEPLRDLDRRYFLFTEKFGKMAGKAVSARKITSKLAPHLEPGNIVRVRFVERNGVVVVDALKTGRVPEPERSEKVLPTIHNLYYLNELLPENQPEPELWELLTQKPFAWMDILRVLGWDPEGAVCAHCGRSDITHFYIRRQEFFCPRCASKLRGGEVLLIATPNGKV